MSKNSQEPLSGCIMASQYPSTDYIMAGHVACPGCGAVIAMKFALQALGPQTILVIPACCWAVVAGVHPQTSLKVPVLHTAFETSGAAASGVRAALDMKGDTETTVVAWAGDGGTFDIGFQSLSGACERNENFLYVCYDNEAYMNTGVQRSSATPYGAQTTTTPKNAWKSHRKKNIIDALAAHRIPYAATVNIAFPDDMMRKFKKAKEIQGTRFIHAYASCPTGWRIPSDQAVAISRLAVQTNLFPLYEVENGTAYTINYQGDRPVAEYLNKQGRFKHLAEKDHMDIQEMVNADWELLKGKAGMFK
jgi:pyruvate ferredoxin oxidoreductase beta subunit/2-oxoisovalerate ferredoxin oxidoreductase beta subunit